MPEDIVDKVLVVTSISPSTELATGDTIYVVAFADILKSTPEVLSRIPVDARQTIGKTISAVVVQLWVKADEIPYKVGSKWRLRIHKNGTANVMEEK